MIYFIQCGDGPIKIGLTNNPARRLQMLQTGHFQRLELIGAIRGDRRTESQWHDRFAVLRLEGEWFKPAPELLAAIEGALRPDKPKPAPEPIEFVPVMGWDRGEPVEAVRAQALAYLAGRPTP